MAADMIRRTSCDELAVMRVRETYFLQYSTRPCTRGRAARERWLREEVAPVYDAMAADPGRALSADSVFAEIRTRHARRLKAGS